MDLLRNALPQFGICPACGQGFRVIGRSGVAVESLNATDRLEWRCIACGHQETENRRRADGADGDWPLSKFDAINSPSKPS